MTYLDTLLDAFLTHAKSIALFPLGAENRVYVLYLASSIVIAFVIYLRSRSGDKSASRSFLRFLFPRDVWSHQSAWLDLRYFVFHQLIGHFLMLGLGAGAAALSFRLIAGVPMSAATGGDPLTGWAGILAATGYMFVALIVSDFLGFYMHYLQHKIPVLWQFHKVHHSAEVMHPLSNYREHPVDNLFYGLLVGAGYGTVISLAFTMIGYVPAMPSLLGVPVLLFMFNIAGYNLRHSHIWLKWPGVWSKVFPSPAHHHVHHSCHPDHLDKNFAFMFPVWDVLFGTYVMPEDNRDVKFGVTDKDNGQELDSCLKLYFLPVRDAWRVLRRKPRRKAQAASEHSRVPAAE